MIEGTIIDDRTVVFSEGYDATSTHTPDDDAIQAALNTIDSSPELEYARGHNRYIFG